MRAIAATVPPSRFPQRHCRAGRPQRQAAWSGQPARDQRPRASLPVGWLLLGKICRPQAAVRQAVCGACARALQWCDPWQARPGQVARVEQGEAGRDAWAVRGTGSRRCADGLERKPARADVAVLAPWRGRRQGGRRNS